MRGCSCRGSRAARREERRRERHDPSNLRKRLARFRIAQSLTLLAYLLYCVFAGDLSSSERLPTIFVALSTFVTLLITATTRAMTLAGCQSKAFLVYSIAADAVCLALQLFTVTSLIVSESSAQCLAGSGRPGHPCGVVWASLVLSSVLPSSFIHTIVTAAILIAVLRRQGGRGLSVSTPDEDPPAYPDLDGDMPSSSNGDTLVLGEDRGNSPKVGVENTSVVSSTTLTGPAFTPRSSSESDSDDGREDRPLLRF